MSHDPVTSPEHYDLGLNGLEVLDVINALGWGDAYLKANALKYLMRHEKKGNALQDLRKARYCLDRLIERLEDDAVAAPLASLHYDPSLTPQHVTVGGEAAPCPGRHVRWTSTAGDPQGWEGEALEADEGPAWERARAVEAEEARSGGGGHVGMHRMRPEDGE